MTEREYLRVRKIIENKYLEDLKALDRVWTLFGPSKREGKGHLTAKLDKAIKSFRPGDILTVRDVEKRIKNDNPGFPTKLPSIASAMSRLADAENGIVVQTRGKGRRGSVYRRVA